MCFNSKMKIVSACAYVFSFDLKFYSRTWCNLLLLLCGGGGGGTGGGKYDTFGDFSVVLCLVLIFLYFKINTLTKACLISARRKYTL